MAGRLWHLVRNGPERLRWPLAGLAATVLILACVLVIPQWLVRLELGAEARTLTAADKAKAINDIRATLLQGVGGAVILLGAYFTYRQLQTGREQLAIAQQGQVTERFTRAIDQLGHAELDVQLGGIYALERIANDSPDDRATIAEVLTAFVRGHAPWPPTLPGQYLADAPIKQVPELRVRAPNVQAALTVLARRLPSPEFGGHVDLHATDLRKASLADADLRDADLDGASLQGTRLDRADLQSARLGHAQLQGASLSRAQLQKAIFTDANLHEAHLDHAQLQGASLNRANLQKARLGHAQLQGASLYRADLQKARLDYANLQSARLDVADLHWASLNAADLQEASLDRAQLQSARLDYANLQSARLNAADLHWASLIGANLQKARLNGAKLQEAGLDRARLQHAEADARTIWPAGFDPRRAGVVLADR